MIPGIVVTVVLAVLALTALAACIVGGRKEREANRRSTMPGRKR